MPIVVQLTTGGAGTTGSPGANDISFTIDLLSGADRAFALWVDSESNTISNSNWFSQAWAGAQELNAHTGRLSGGGAEGMAYRLFTFAGALPTGNQQIVITQAGNTDFGRYVAAVITGVSAFANIANYENVATNAPSTTVPSSGGNLVMMMGAARNQTPATPGAGVTQEFHSAFFGSTSSHGIWTKPGEASTAIGVTLPGSCVWISSVFELVSAGGGSSGGGAASELQVRRFNSEMNARFNARFN